MTDHTALIAQLRRGFADYRDGPIMEAAALAIEEGCWEWTGKKTPDGYGYVVGGRGGKYVHRIVYEALVGPIPEGLELDHLCRNPSCARPDHLEPVTTRENVLRGEGVTAQNARKTHCDAGHPFDDANTYVRPEGRYCRTCRNDTRQRYGATPKGRATQRARDERKRLLASPDTRCSDCSHPDEDTTMFCTFHQTHNANGAPIPYRLATASPDTTKREAE